MSVSKLFWLSHIFRKCKTQKKPTSLYYVLLGTDYYGLMWFDLMDHSAANGLAVQRKLTIIAAASWKWHGFL
jgi:hypothetical protein